MPSGVAPGSAGAATAFAAGGRRASAAGWSYEPHEDVAQDLMAPASSACFRSLDGAAPSAALTAPLLEETRNEVRKHHGPRHTTTAT